MKVAAYLLTNLCCFLGLRKQPFLPTQRVSFIHVQSLSVRDWIKILAVKMPVVSEMLGAQRSRSNLTLHQVSCSSNYPRRFFYMWTQRAAVRPQARAEGCSKRQRDGEAPLNGGGYYVQVSSGLKHACALSRHDSRSALLGRNDYGESSPPSGRFVQVGENVFACLILSLVYVRHKGQWSRAMLGQKRHGPKLSSFLSENAFQQVNVQVSEVITYAEYSRETVPFDAGAITAAVRAKTREGKFLQVSAGTRTTCAIRVETDQIDDGHDADSMFTTVFCWGSRANSLMDRGEQRQQAQPDLIGSRPRLRIGKEYR
ncbi:hypothetical protein ACHAW5_003046 [Stephanodiscus triporus]|uniref:Uncharacterized protein n=1 Tax=Stephanodiscus triporus TaxID=2934178 RepID=A0ABD3P0A4_9STRA